MAVAVQELTITDVDRVVSATLDVYARRCDLAAEMPLAELLSVPSDLGALRAVVGAADRTVEIVLDADIDAAAVAPATWALAAKGFATVVLVGLDEPQTLDVVSPGLVHIQHPNTHVAGAQHARL